MKQIASPVFMSSRSREVSAARNPFNNVCVFYALDMEKSDYQSPVRPQHLASYKVAFF